MVILPFPLLAVMKSTVCYNREDRLFVCPAFQSGFLPRMPESTESMLTVNHRSLLSWIVTHFFLLLFYFINFIVNMSIPISCYGNYVKENIVSI